MTPFLKQVVDHYHKIGNIGDKLFVFPNRRSMVFFRKYLAEAVQASAGGPLVVPQLCTINDLFYKLAGEHSVDRVTLLLDLYSCYCSLNPKAETLDEFVFWGDVLLGDFNDVDKYLVDPYQLFANVADLKQIQDTYSYLSATQRKAIENFIGHFSDISGRLTVDIESDNPDVKARFLQIWNLLHDLYKDYNSLLEKKGHSYEGMVYRKVAQKVKEGQVVELMAEAFPSVGGCVFVCLNALNECEKVLLRKLRDASLAEFCWDYSGSMISDSKNRSSLFMSENVIEFPQAAQWDKDGVKVPELNVVSISSSVGQAKRLPEILKEISEPEDCAVILPDENLLMPVLNSIPLEIEDINVTMGLPMTGSLLYSMMNDIASIQLHAVNRGGKWYFYHKHVWDLCSNDLFKESLDEESKEIISGARADARYYISQERLNGTKFLDTVFRVAVTDLKERSLLQIDRFAEYQKDVLRVVASAVSRNSAMDLELEYAREYFRSVNILQDILGKEESTVSGAVLPATYVRLLSQILSAVSVPFRGEPLKGLQIMGPLETRGLDFKNLIIMSANEGVFPRKTVSSSFIPPELRKAFGLPTFEYQDAVWAYYFYRMISRAERVWMMVDSRTEGLKSGEESRYIKQLEYHFGIKLNRYVVNFSAMKTGVVPEINKTEDDIACIRDTVMSATALQNYLACPAKFYYSTIKKLRTEEDVTESLDYGMFGTVYHDLMRAIYTGEFAMAESYSFDNQQSEAGQEPLRYISREYIRQWKGRDEDIRKKVYALIIEELGVMEVAGRNLVVADVIVRYVKETLQSDLILMEKAGVDSFEMIGRELRVTGTFHGLRFKGFIDRLDSFSPGSVRVVDYKTGKVLDDDVDIHDGNAQHIADTIFAVDVKDRPKIALQFFIYDMLLRSRDEVAGMQIQNCVYSTTKLFSELPLSVPMNDVFYQAVSEHLKDTIDEMMNPEVGFRRTQDSGMCTYCDFKTICGR